MKSLNADTKMLICAFSAYPDGKMVKSVLTERVIDADMNAVIHEIFQTYKDNVPIVAAIPDSELAVEKEPFLHTQGRSLFLAPVTMG